MNDNTTRRSVAPEATDVQASRFIAYAFLISTLASIGALLGARLYWVLKVFNIIGFEWNAEEIYSWSVWKFHIVSGDPAFMLYIPAFIIALALILFGRNRGMASDRLYLWSFKCMIIYSATMIVIQLIIKIALYYEYENSAQFFDRDQFFTWTILTWGEPPGAPPTNAVTLLSVDDPHLVTLLGAFIGLMALADPGLVRRILRYIIGRADAK
jgi:hypothetical protein